MNEAQLRSIVTPHNFVLPQKIGKSNDSHVIFIVFSIRCLGPSFHLEVWGQRGEEACFPPESEGCQIFPFWEYFHTHDTSDTLFALISIGGYLYKPRSLADIVAIKSQDSIFSKTFQMQVVGDVYVAEPDDFSLKHPWYQEFTSFHKRFPSIPW